MKVRGAIARLTSDSLVYGLGQAAGRMIQIVLVPALTRAFTPAEYGVVDLVLLVAAIATMFSVCGMDAALARFFYEAPDREARRAMATTSAVHRLAGGIALGGAIALLAQPLSTLILDSPSYAKYLRLLGLSLPFTSFFLFANEALRVTFQPWKYIALNTINMVLVGVLTLWFVLGLRLSVAGVFYAKVVGDATAALAGLLLLRHTLGARPSWATLRRMLAYGGPLIPLTLTYSVLTYADRQVLVHMGSLADVGVYAVAVKLAAPVLLTVTAFQLAWGPTAFAAAANEDHGAFYGRVLTLYVAGGSLMALGVAMFAPEILRAFIPSAYWGAARPAGLLALATVANGAYFIAALGVNLERKNGWLALIAGLGAVITVALAILCVPRWGVTGVAWATLVGFSLSTAMLYVKSQSLRPFPYRGLACLCLFALATALAAASWRMESSLAVRGALWIAFAGVAAGFALSRRKTASPALRRAAGAEVR